jgi:uncharacterized membrane protein YfcA
VTGFGFALLAVPSLVLLLPVRDAIVVAALVSLGNISLVALSTRGHADRWTVARLLLGSLVGMPVGLAVLLVLAADVLRVLVGVSTVVMAVAVARNLTLPVRGAGADVAVGFACGILSTSTGMNGPPLVLYLQSRKLAPTAFRATLARFFLASGVLSQISFALGGILSSGALLLAAAGVPAALVGHRLGTAVVARVSPRLFRRLVLLVLATAAALGTAVALARLV